MPSARISFGGKDPEVIEKSGLSLISENAVNIFLKNNEPHSPNEAKEGLWDVLIALPQTGADLKLIVEENYLEIFFGKGTPSQKNGVSDR